MTGVRAGDRARVAGLILAGGAGKRMGVDKATIRTDGRSQLEHVAATLCAVFDTVLVSVRHGDQNLQIPSGLETVVDGVPDAGPLTGIVAAHRRLPDRAIFVVAVDLFGLTESVVRAVLRAREGQGRCSVTALAAYTGRGASDGASPVPDPLCAIWEPDILRTAADEFSRGLRAPFTLLKTTTVQIVPQSRSVFNINTPEDLAAYAGTKQVGQEGCSARTDPS